MPTSAGSRVPASSPRRPRPPWGHQRRHQATGRTRRAYVGSRVGRMAAVWRDVLDEDSSVSGGWDRQSGRSAPGTAAHGRSIPRNTHFMGIQPPVSPLPTIDPCCHTSASRDAEPRIGQRVPPPPVQPSQYGRPSEAGTVSATRQPHGPNGLLRGISSTRRPQVGGFFLPVSPAVSGKPSASTSRKWATRARTARVGATWAGRRARI